MTILYDVGDGIKGEKISCKNYAQTPKGDKNLL